MVVSQKRLMHVGILGKPNKPLDAGLATLAAAGSVLTQGELVERFCFFHNSGWCFSICCGAIYFETGLGANCFF